MSPSLTYFVESDLMKYLTYLSIFNCKHHIRTKLYNPIKISLINPLFNWLHSLLLFLLFLVSCSLTFWWTTMLCKFYFFFVFKALKIFLIKFTRKINKISNFILSLSLNNRTHTEKKSSNNKKKLHNSLIIS